MERYIEQLIGDIHERMQNADPPSDLWLESVSGQTDETEPEGLAYIDEYLYGEKKPISRITGFDLNLFPPPERLNKEQQALLACELEKLLLHLNFYLDFPANYPNHLRYPFILKFWAEEHVHVSFGESHIEFCSYDEEDCPFPGYCTSCADFNASLSADNKKQHHESDEESNETD